MSWTNECVDCEKKISDDYERCYECNQERNSEELPITYTELKVDLDKSWVLVIKGMEVVLPKSQCTIDEDTLKVWVPRWLAEKKEID